MAVQAALLHDAVPVDAQVTDVSLREAISECFDCEVTFVAPDSELDLEAMIGSTAAVQIYDDAYDPADPAHARFVHGIVEEAEYVEPLAPHGHRYRVRLRPPLHGLAYRHRTRIFQQKSPVDCIKQVFEEAGIAADSVRWAVAGYTPRDYVTQWKESELAFVKRWLEELGIRFWFEHDEVGPTMIVSDEPTQHEPIAGDPGLTVRVRDGNPDQTSDGLFEVSFETRFCHDRWSARDWNFMTPDAPRQTTAGDGGLERYEFPGGYPDDATAGWISSVRAQELVAMKNVLEAESDCRRLVPGRAFEIVDCHPDGLIGRYLVVRAEHRYERRIGTGDTGGRFVAKLEAIPAEVPFRPARTTPRPRAWGKESAVVTGPAGEEIHVDSMGQIKVHFYWDREQPVDDTASCWVRVQQLNTAGTMILPRVGWEVDVGFLYGDPDRPVVLQKLYTQEQMPPYALPANLMQSSLQTSSSPGGGGTNEIRMNDANGSQEFFVHAQKDMATTIGHNASEDIGVDSTIQVGSDYAHKIGADETIDIGGNQSLSVTGALTIDTIASQTVTVAGVDDWGVGAVHTMRVTGSRTDDIGGLLNVLAQQVAHTFNAGHTLEVGGALALNAAQAITESVAGSKTELVGGAKLELLGKAKAENIGVGKILNAGALEVKAGTDVNIGATGALAITTGGALSTKCGGDFGISGRSVTFTLGNLKIDAGSKITATGGSITIKGSSVGGAGAKVLLKGTVNYK